MSRSESQKRFVWYELFTSEPQSAKPFYTELIGRGTTEWGEGDFPYTMWTLGENPIGGVMEFPADVKAAGVPTHWLGYVGTPDVDATVEQAERLGGMFWRCRAATSSSSARTRRAPPSRSIRASRAAKSATAQGGSARSRARRPAPDYPP